MNKRNITKLENLVEKLKNANYQEAYNTACNLINEDILNNILDDLIKEDFSIAPSHASFFFCNNLESFVVGKDYIEIFYYFSKDDLELKIVVAGIKYKTDKSVPMGTIMDIYRRWCCIENFEESLPPNIVSNLSNFKEESSGVLVCSMGKIKNFAQFKKEVIPVWNATLEILKSFEE